MAEREGALLLPILLISNHFFLAHFSYLQPCILGGIGGVGSGWPMAVGGMDDGSELRVVHVSASGFVASFIDFDPELVIEQGETWIMPRGAAAPGLTFQG